MFTLILKSQEHKYKPCVSNTLEDQGGPQIVVTPLSTGLFAKLDMVECTDLYLRLTARRSFVVWPSGVYLFVHVHYVAFVNNTLGF